PASEPDRALRAVTEILDRQSWFGPDLWTLLRFAADYYQRELGEVMAMALPTALRRLRLPKARPLLSWRLRQHGPDLARTPLQARLLGRLQADGQTQSDLLEWEPQALSGLQQLRRRGIVEAVPLPIGQAGQAQAGPNLSEAQQSVVDAIGAGQGFQSWLLQGVTGSGKTEV
ncbi:MAG: hypothetical protein KDI56_10555, partial [Xanthomonadales bacterium]|nr:hypothetical protein [Xanthomonadales bacterium]